MVFKETNRKAEEKKKGGRIAVASHVKNDNQSENTSQIKMSNQRKSTSQTKFSDQKWNMSHEYLCNQGI